MPSVACGLRCPSHPGMSCVYSTDRQPGRQEACTDTYLTGIVLCLDVQISQSKQTTCNLGAGWRGRTGVRVSARNRCVPACQTFAHSSALRERRESVADSLRSFFSTTGRRIERPEEAGRGSPPLLRPKTGVDGGARRRRRARDNVPGADSVVPRVPGPRRKRRAPPGFLANVLHFPVATREGRSREEGGKAKTRRKTAIIVRFHAIYAPGPGQRHPFLPADWSPPYATRKHLHRLCGSPGVLQPLVPVPATPGSA